MSHVDRVRRPALPTTVTLRRVEAGDREALISIFATTRERELALLPRDDTTRTIFVRQQFEAQDRAWRAAHPHGRFDVVVHEGEVVGRLYVDRTGEGLHVIDIALRPDVRGRGIGSHLLGELVAEAEADGIPLTLYVERTNPALRLYTRLGFELVAEQGIHLLLRRSAAVS